MTLFFLLLGLSVAWAETCTLHDLETLENHAYNQIIALNEKLVELAGYEECLSTRAEINQADWPSLKGKIWSDRRFRNSHPGAECNSRAALLSYELDRLGYQSEKIYLRGGILTTLPDVEGVKAFNYGSHLVNVVSLRRDNGTVEKMVLDPMFTEDLMPIETYIDSLRITGSVFPIEKKMVNQVSEPGMSILHPRDYAAHAGQDRCRYSNVYLERHRELLQVNEARGELPGPSSPTVFKSRARAQAVFLFLETIFNSTTTTPVRVIDPILYDDILKYFDSNPARAEQKAGFLKFYLRAPK